MASCLLARMEEGPCYEQYMQEQLRLSAFFGGEGQGETLVRRSGAMGMARPVPVFAPPMAQEHLTDAVEDCRRRLCRRFYTLPGQDGPERYPYTQLTAQMADAVHLLHAALRTDLAGGFPAAHPVRPGLHHHAAEPGLHARYQPCGDDGGRYPP